MNNILQVLMYFFEAVNDDVLQDSAELADLTGLHDTHLSTSLLQAQKILPWLQQIRSKMSTELYPLQTPTGVRVFSPVECQKLSKKCRGLLLSLEYGGILTPVMREYVMDELMQLEPAQITIKRIKWIVLAMLSAQGHKIAAVYMERIAFDIQDHQLH